MNACNHRPKPLISSSEEKLNNLQKLSYQQCFALGLLNHVRPAIKNITKPMKKNEGIKARAKKETYDGPNINRRNKIKMTYNHARGSNISVIFRPLKIPNQATHT